MAQSRVADGTDARPSSDLLTAYHPPQRRKKTYYSYYVTHWLHNFGKQRLVINERQADLSDQLVFSIANRLHWQSGHHSASSPSLARGSRSWGRQGRRAGQDQLRDFAALKRQVALVAVVYSQLRTVQPDRALQDKLQRELKMTLEGSAASWRRAIQAQALWSLALFLSAGLNQGLTLHTPMAPLLHTVYTR
jgi:hypothetical protein